MWLVFFPLNPAWGKLKITLSNRLILRSVCSFIVFALTPCKVTAPIFFSSAKLDSAPLYFFRVSVQNHLKISGNLINKKNRPIRVIYEMSALFISGYA